MYKLHVLSVGKTKEAWLEEALAEYIKRLGAWATIKFSFVKNDAELEAAVAKEKHVICLDEHGKMFTSEEFSTFLVKELEKGQTHLALVIGSATGLTKALRVYPSISLSPMTLTHQMVRLLLVEQLYRGLSIASGGKYHKE